jgi:hypothetical protein
LIWRFVDLLIWRFGDLEIYHVVVSRSAEIELEFLLKNFQLPLGLAETTSNCLGSVPIHIHFIQGHLS